MSMIQQPVSRRRFLQAAGTLTGLSLVAACTLVGSPSPSTGPAGDTAPTGPQRGGTLTVVLPGTVTSLDPALVRGYDMQVLILSLYEPLVKLDAERVAQPALAEAWEVSEDGLQWTFTLRPDVIFHHGTALQAQDVVHTFTRVLDPDFGSPYRQILQFVAGVEALDASTVQFTLRGPNIEFPQYLSAYATCIVPHDRSDEELATAPSGTGPFRLTEYVPGESAYTVRNESYRIPDLPYLDEVRHVYMTESATQITALTSGTADVLWQVGVESLGALESNPDIQILEVAAGAHQPIHMRVTEPPFDDLRVRQALKQLINRNDMRQAVLQGRGTLGNDQPISTVSPYWAEIPALTYDVEGAKALLAEAGYADGLALTLTTTSARPGMLETAVVFQEMAKAAGVTITINQLPADAYFPVSMERHGNFFMDNWAMLPTDNLMLTVVYSSQGPLNIMGWHTPELDSMIAATRSEADMAARQELYTQIQTLIGAEGATIIPYFRPVLAAARSGVEGLILTPDSFMDFSATWLAEA
ncbi:MAG: ABC transporter substrate-binding protein [Caldilineaceae bacterium]|nr:ABC transporter substrate-binding protein [Caldilineaceae bacterium]